MAVYKNISNAVKEFYGVKFNPGSTHKVNGCINDSKMIRLADTADTDDKAPLTTPKKVEDKPEIKVTKNSKDTGGKIDG